MIALITVMSSVSFVIGFSFGTIFERTKNDAIICQLRNKIQEKMIEDGL